MKKKILLCLAFTCILAGMTSASRAYAAGLPQKYRNENLSSVKNQQTEGLCWSFASAAAMEAELIQNNGVSEDINISEVQLAYFVSNPALDELGQMNLMYSGSFDYLTGGTATAIAFRLRNGNSPVMENEVPFAYDDAALHSKMDETLAYTGQYYLKEVRIMNHESRDEIKKAVMAYGAVTTDINGMAWQNYNEETHAWYNPYPSTNHEVCIIGWDDSFPKENFLVTPEGDGAWIVKNSWGEEWGENGYFYVSYYDKSLTQAVVFDMEPKAYSDQIYQNAFSSGGAYLFDENGNGYFSNLPLLYEKVANIFTADANSDGGEQLTAVSFYTNQAVDYTIWIYKNVTESGQPESGTLATTLKGKISYPGSKIIPLEKPLYLSEGESFAVVISTIDSEGRYAGVTASSSGKWWIPTPGESYVWLGDGRWMDCAVSLRSNLTIQAYTDDVKKNVSMDNKMVAMTQKEDAAFAGLELPEEVNGVQVVYCDSASVTISWDSRSGADFTVYQYNDVAKTWKRIGVTKQNYFTVTGLQAGTSYTFGVKEVDIAGAHESREFAEITAKTASEVQAVLTTKQGEKGVILSWTEVKGATKYLVYVLSPATDYEWEKINTVQNKSKLVYTDENVIPGLQYVYRIQAYKGSKRISSGIPVSVVYE